MSVVTARRHKRPLVVGEGDDVEGQIGQNNMPTGRRKSPPVGQQKALLGRTGRPWFLFDRRGLCTEESRSKIKRSKRCVHDGHHSKLVQSQIRWSRQLSAAADAQRQRGSTSLSCDPHSFTETQGRFNRDSQTLYDRLDVDLGDGLAELPH